MERLLSDYNESALRFITNLICHARTKHIEIEHHFIREKVLVGCLAVEYVRSQENIVDIFTKPLFKGTVERIHGLLGLIFDFKFKGLLNIIVQPHISRGEPKNLKVGSPGRGELNSSSYSPM